VAHRLAVQGWLSLMIYWYSLPARALGAFIRHRVKVPGLSTVIKLVIGFLVLRVFLVAFFTSFDGYFVMMISPVFAPTGYGRPRVRRTAVGDLHRPGVRALSPINGSTARP